MSQKTLRFLFFILILIGIILRFAEFTANRSLSSDEAITANRLAEISIHDSFFLKGKDHRQMQSYPIGFLSLEKLSMKFLGSDERSLRFYPFICGIISLLIFLILARKLVGEYGALLALGLFALSRNIIFYSSELKPYSSDILIALILLLVLQRIIERPVSIAHAFGLGVVGGVATYFSFPAVFIIAAVGGSLLVYCAFKKGSQNVRTLTIFCFISGLFFLVYYLASVRFITSDEELMKFWQPNFMPITEGLFQWVEWMISAFKRVFYKSLKVPVSLSALMFVFGCCALYLKNKKYFILLVSPIVLLLILSGLRIYPFDGRVILFLLPLFILISVFGILVITHQTSDQKIRRILFCLIAVFLLFYPAVYSIWQFQEAFGPEEIKPVLQLVSAEKESSDLVVVNRGAYNAYKYYAPRYGLPEDVDVINWRNTDLFNQDKYRGKRVWVVFTHVKFYKQENERLVIVEELSKHGILKKKKIVKVKPYSVIPTLYENITSSTYLFQF